MVRVMWRYYECDNRLQVDKCRALDEKSAGTAVAVVEAIDHCRSRTGLWR